jgi:hypothetical protein
MLLGVEEFSGADTPTQAWHRCSRTTTVPAARASGGGTGSAVLDRISDNRPAGDPDWLSPRRKASFIGRLLICWLAAIMKDNRRHPIPLTRIVAEILKDLPKAGLDIPHREGHPCSNRPDS